MMSRRLFLCCLAAIAAVCGAALSDDLPATQVDQPTQATGAGETEKGTIAINFAGGTVKDLATYLQEKFDVAMAVAEPMDFAVGPLQFTAPNVDQVYVLLGGMGRVARRPGYLITPKDPTGKETQPTDLKRPDRPADKVRDESTVGPIKADGVVLTEALGELATLYRVPFIYEGTPSAEAFAVDAPKCSVRELIEALASHAGCVAKPVYVLYGMTPDNVAQVLDYTSDEEILEGFEKNFGMYANLPKELRMQIFAFAFGELQNMSPEDRAQAIQYAQDMFGTMFDRLASMQGAGADGVRQKVAGVIDDGLEFYRGLSAGQRGQVQPLAEYFTRMRQKF